MNKYRGPNDRNFLLVSDRIKTHLLGSEAKLASRVLCRYDLVLRHCKWTNNLLYHRHQTHQPPIWQLSQEEAKCHQTLRTSDYESHKARVPDRVDGTCRWVLVHPHFRYWWRSSSSRLLWVSADPGCGKSVLAKSLIDKDLESTERHTTCYFFFKDDNAEQTSATNAICAILHQLFRQKQSLLSHAMSDYRDNGFKLSRLFERLWSILKEAAADSEAGTIVCIIDALDECEESSRTRLLKYLDHFYNDTSGNDRKDIKLKILITSRPYFHIERDLRDLISKYPVIRLAGEAETQSISREINLVINVEVRKLGAALDLDELVQLTLREELCKYKNRTYLWLHLILEVIRRRLETTSQRQIRKILNSVPDTVDKAYSAILERSENQRSARKLLRIILSAVRPLTLREMNVAMTIEASCTSFDDLDVVPEDQWKVIIRNLCGLFVTVVDSRVYLIHQTARDFLLSTSESSISTPERAHMQEWKYSVTLRESNLTLAQICIWYLLFAVFDVEGLQLRPGLRGTKKAPEESDIVSYSSEHLFLGYAAEHWAFHFRESYDGTDRELLEAVSFEICNAQSLRFANWFPVYWTRAKKNETHYPYDIKSIMVACHLGLDPVVLLLLQQEAEVDGLFSLGRTPLSWAAEAGNISVVRLLLEQCTNSNVKQRNRNVWRAAPTAYKNKIKSAIGLKSNYGREISSTQSASPSAQPFSRVDIRARPVSKQRIGVNTVNTRGETPLMLAAMSGHKGVVELLIENNARTDCKDCDQETAAVKSARNGHEEVVMLLLERTSWKQSKSQALKSVWIEAAMSGQGTVVRSMLDHGISKELKDENGQTALSLAAGTGHLHVVELLLEHAADIETKDRNGNTPLMHAVKRSHDNTAAKVLQHHANVEARNKAGQTATSLALQMDKSGPTIRWGALGLLLDYGASMNLNHAENITILLQAARKGKTGVLKFLLERQHLSIESSEGPKRNSSGILHPYNKTPLMEAAIGGQTAIVELLLERNANIEARDSEGNTPLAWAARAGRPSVVSRLIENSADVESRNIQGETPLLCTVQHDRARLNEREIVLETLLVQGANAEAKGNDGMTPILWGVTHGWAAVVRLLLEHNVRTDYKDQNGRTILELAEYLGEKSVIALLLKLDVQSASERDWTRTPLSEAAEKGHESVVKQYHDEGHNIETKDAIFGQSPLLWAAENGHEAVIRMLLDRNAQIESKNKFGQTALWLAVRNGHVPVVRLLLERDANIEIEDNAARTPSMLAEHSTNTTMKVIIENRTKPKADPV